MEEIMFDMNLGNIPEGSINVFGELVARMNANVPTNIGLRGGKTICLEITSVDGQVVTGKEWGVLSRRGRTKPIDPTPREINISHIIGFPKS
jgi:hypothetical protein